jgi:alpha-L-fucosidase
MPPPPPRLQDSWGFRRNAAYTDYLTFPELLSQVISTVAFGGNILINIGPAHDGTLSPIFADRLTSLGAWLKVNGEAIYSTTPWRVQNETAAGVYYTAVNATGAVYAMTQTWPAGNTLVLDAPVTSANTTVTMLGYGPALAWQSNGASGGLTITVPALTPDLLPSVYGWTFKLANVA